MNTKFTVEESNLIGIFLSGEDYLDLGNRLKVIKGINIALPYLKDTELVELSVRVLEKIGNMSDEEFTRNEFITADSAIRKELYNIYADDCRKGVKQVIAKFKQEDGKLLEELKRLDKMRVFEKKYAAYQNIAGVDEAGRGPLAGPVVAGAVILPVDCEILYLNDSKKLSAVKRERLFDEITEKAVACGVGIE